MRINKIHVLGLANAFKPLEVLSILNDDSSTRSSIIKKMKYITNEETGIVVDFCIENNIEVLVIDDKNINGTTNLLKLGDPDLLISLGWNKKIPIEFINIYKNAINCHGGLLPMYRGNRVYMHVYANIPDYYGVTIHYLDEEYDSGNIIAQAKIKLFLEESPKILHRRLNELTALILPNAIKLVENEYTGIPQKGKARFFKSISREQMDEIRNINIENLRKNKLIVLTPHKEWIL